MLDFVCRSSGLSSEEVLHSRREECVDARSVLVSVLCERLTDSQVAELIGLKRRGVNGLRNGFAERARRWGVRMLHEDVKRLSCGRRELGTELA